MCPLLFSPPRPAAPSLCEPVDGDGCFLATGSPESRTRIRIYIDLSYHPSYRVSPQVSSKKRLLPETGVCRYGNCSTFLHFIHKSHTESAHMSCCKINQLFATLEIQKLIGRFIFYTLNKLIFTKRFTGYIYTQGWALTS